MSIALGEAEGDSRGDRALSWCVIARSDGQHAVGTAMGSRDRPLGMVHMGHLGKGWGLGEDHRPRCPTRPVSRSENSADWVRS